MALRKHLFRSLKLPIVATCKDLKFQWVYSLDFASVHGPCVCRPRKIIPGNSHNPTHLFICVSRRISSPLGGTTLPRNRKRFSLATRVAGSFLCLETHFKMNIYHEAPAAVRSAVAMWRAAPGSRAILDPTCNEHSEQAWAPYTEGLGDVPRWGL
jgi:hypothetical protein